MGVELGVPGIGMGSRVGAGGFGTVYQAEQLGFGRSVAIKILSSVLEEDVELRRFERERRALGSVADHPKIVSVFDWGLTADRRPYLVMEHLPGGTLADLVKAGPLAPEVAVSVTAKLARALAVAHERGVLHRDVKPENVLISAFGEPVLCDFGIARLADGATTHTSSVAASVAHAAPEVLEGAPPSEAIDIWALASTLHTMLAGRPPFARGSGQTTMTAHIARVLTQPPPDLRLTGVPDDVAALVEAGLVKDPANRLTNATEVAERLEAVMSAHHWSHQLLPVNITPTEAAPAANHQRPRETGAEPVVVPVPPGTLHLGPKAGPTGLEAALGYEPRQDPPDPVSGRTGGRVIQITAASILAVVVLVTIGLVARRSATAPWTVTLDGSEVVVKEGGSTRETKPLQANQLPTDIQAELRRGKRVRNRAEADSYIDAITRQAIAAGTLQPPGAGVIVTTTTGAITTTAVSAAGKPTVLITTTVPITTTPAPIPAVTRDQVLNMTLPASHSCEYADDAFLSSRQLTNGKLRGAQGDNGGAVDVQDVLLADVDGDGGVDGVARLVCSSGAGGSTSAILILSAKTGRATELPYGKDAESKLTNLSVYRVSEMTISGADLRLRVSGHAPDDPTCCPSAEALVTYRLGAGGPQFTGARVS